MATNRVHNTDILNSVDFDELSLGAQVLYTRCVANADDMGAVEVESIFRTASKVRRPAIKELIDSGLVTLIRQRGTVVYINGFHCINSFAKHGAKRSRYEAELMQNCDIKNALSKLKIKDSGNPMLGSAMLGSALQGSERQCFFFDMYNTLLKKTNFSNLYPHTANSLGDFYQHLDELHADGATETSVQVMIEQCAEKAEEHGDYTVSEYIDKATANCWKNINWQFLEREQSGDFGFWQGKTFYPVQRSCPT